MADGDHYDHIFKVIDYSSRFSLSPSPIVLENAIAEARRHSNFRFSWLATRVSGNRQLPCSFIQTIVLTFFFFGGVGSPQPP